jgi:hypothetical protein
MQCGEMPDTRVVEVKTCWRTTTGRPPDALRAAGVTTSIEILRDADSDLFTLIGQSLARGHDKVALQRGLMCVASGSELPMDLITLLEEVVPRCRRSEIMRMWKAACAWAEMVGARREIHLASPAAAHRGCGLLNFLHREH